MRLIGRCLVAVAVVVVAATASVPAGASFGDDAGTGSGGAELDGRGLNAYANAVGIAPAVRGGSAPPCQGVRRTNVDGEWVEEAYEGRYRLRDVVLGDDYHREARDEERPGLHWRFECEDPEDPSNYTWLGVIFIPDVDSEHLPQFAFDSLGIGAPPVAMSPAPDQRHLVNLPTWLWLDPDYWQPRQLSVTALWVTVTARAEPVLARWSMGDGTTVTCDGPGTPYDTSRPAAAQTTTCSHTYRSPSAGRAGEVTVVWEGTATVNGSSRSLGTAERSSSFSVAVAESQAVVTG